MKVIETYDNLSYEITDEQHAKIMQQSSTGESKGIWLGGDYIAWSSIKAIHESLHGYGQPYEELPAKGITGILEAPKSKNAKEALLRGLEKAKKRLMVVGGMKETRNLDEMIKHVKNGSKFSGRGMYDPKYKTDEQSSGYEKAVEAGVVFN